MIRKKNIFSETTISRLYGKYVVAQVTYSFSNEEEEPGC